MDKRYQVFVSSTYEDLREERQEIMQALLELDCIPAGMELFPAANEDQWTLIKKVIDDCDYYLVVIGGRYGSIGPAGLSYTQMEYEYAVSIGRPVIAFLHKDPESLTAKRVEKTEAGKKKLEIFRELAQKKLCKHWTSPADLGSAVSRSLIKLIKSSPAIGWVKADLLPEKSTTEEILRLRQKIEDLQTQINDSAAASFAGTVTLAQGDDLVTVSYSFGAYLGLKWQPEATYEASFNASWNDLFSAISPVLIDEGSDDAVRKSILEFIERSEASHLKSESRVKGLVVRGFKINDDMFNTVKVQFLALGLMGKSVKRKARSVNDKSTYWTLTPLGEKLMMSLRAIRRPEDN